MKSAKEIIETLEYCSRDVAERCPSCGYFPGTADRTCVQQLKADALELIRLQEMQLGRQAGLIERAYPDPAPEPHDAVNHPSHYTQGGAECIDAIKAATTGLMGMEAVCTANAIKYMWRWKGKNGTEDLRKAVWYLNRLIAETEG